MVVDIDMSEKITEYKNIKVGKLNIEKSLINNNEYRKVTIRNRAGKDILIKNYKNNKLSGKIESYWPNGKVHFEGQFTNGVRSGKFRTYSDKGDILLEENYSKM